MSIMQKFMVVAAIAVLVLLVAGCGQKAAEKAATTPPQPQAQDSTGLDTGAVQQEQQDLNTDELSDIDSGLSEIENI
jgi:PBP1b-binding outer membrane lipoprotein LpoB